MASTYTPSMGAALDTTAREAAHVENALSRLLIDVRMPDLAPPAVGHEPTSTATRF